MTENNNSSKTFRERAGCCGMRGGRKNRSFCGIFFIVVGIFLLGKEAHWFSPEILTLFWPLVFILAGTWCVAAALKNKTEHH
jgi:hypothetical protein